MEHSNWQIAKHFENFKRFQLNRYKSKTRSKLPLHVSCKTMHRNNKIDKDFDKTSPPPREQVKPRPLVDLHKVLSKSQQTQKLECCYVTFPSFQ